MRSWWEGKRERNNPGPLRRDEGEEREEEQEEKEEDGKEEREEEEGGEGGKLEDHDES